MWLGLFKLFVSNHNIFHFFVVPDHPLQSKVQFTCKSWLMTCHTLRLPLYNSVCTNFLLRTACNIVQTRRADMGVTWSKYFANRCIFEEPRHWRKPWWPEGEAFKKSYIHPIREKKWNMEAELPYSTSHSLELGCRRKGQFYLQNFMRLFSALQQWHMSVWRNVFQQPWHHTLKSLRNISTVLCWELLTVIFAHAAVNSHAGFVEWPVLHSKVSWCLWNYCQCSCLCWII